MNGNESSPNENFRFAQTFDPNSHSGADHSLESDPYKVSGAHPVPIPLPMEIPPPPNLSQLPSHILHSGTVETLIGQNEDLFARLKVNIRRNSILEQQIMENERVNVELTRINNALMAQLQVLQEKDRIWREKATSVDSRHNSYNREIDLLRAKLRSAEERSEELEAGLTLESAYRRRVRAWVRPLVDQLRTQLAKSRLHASELARQVSARDAQMSDLKARVEEAVHQLQAQERQWQSQERQFSRDQSKLIDGYESRIEMLEGDLARTKSDASLVREKALRLDEAVAQRTTLENRIVFLERQVKETEDAFAKNAKSAEEQIAKYRQEAKVLAVETLDYDEKLKATAKELTGLRDDYTRLQDQFESLQTLWSESQKRLESSKLQHESLNRLNQELSRQLKEQRKATELSQTKPAPVTAAEPVVAEPKIESRPERTNAASEAPAAPLRPSARLDRIQSLLAQLESGFTVTRRPEAAPLKDLEIIEDAPVSSEATTARQPET